MDLEIERKFRPFTDPRTWREFGFEPLVAWEIWQGYFTPPREYPEIRVRTSRQIATDSLDEVPPRAVLGPEGDETVVRWLTVKLAIETDGTAALSRHEIEAPITEAQFTSSWRLCHGTRLRKTRYEYMANLSDGHRVVVVDMFRDHLEGLVLAELEFGDWEKSKSFEPPGFLGEEVTHDERYLNSSLAAAPGPPT